MIKEKYFIDRNESVIALF